jgi:TonB-dependent receptor
MKNLFLIAFFSLFTYVINAQNATIQGVIIDEMNGQTIPGAKVILDSMTKFASSDFDGKFSFENLSVGDHYVTVKYPTYTTKKVPFILKENEVTEIKISIISTEKELTVARVRTRPKTETTAALLMTQKNATSVTSGITAEEIKKTPDTRTSDVLKRVSGASIQDNKFVVIRGLNDRYNFAMLNDAPLPSSESDRKAFSFDIFPSNMLDNLVITKTATPDLPGEFAGGVINIKTITPRPKNFQTIQLGTSINTITTFKDFKTSESSSTDILGIGAGSRKLPIGIPSTKDFELYTNEQKAEAAKLMTPTWTPKNSYSLPNFNLQYSIGRAHSLKNGHKLGLVFAYNYNVINQANETIRREFEEQSNGVVTKSELKDSVFVKSILNTAMLNLSYEFNDSSRINFYNLYSISSDDRINIRKGVRELDSDPRQWEKSTNFWYTQNLLNTSQLSGSHKVARFMKVNWSTGLSNIVRDIPNQRRVVYQKSTYLEDDTSQNHTAIIQKNGTIPTAAGNMFWAKTNETIYSGKLDLIFPLEIKNHKQEIKVGGSTQYRTRNFSARNLGFSQYKPTGKKFNDSLTLLAPDLIFASSNLGKLESGKGGFKLDEATKVSDSYTANSLLNAAYVMLDSKITKKLRAVGGVRLESYNQHFNYTEFGSNIDKTIDTTVADLLPSINLIYGLTKKMNLRASYYKTVSRPEFRELAPFAFYNFVMDNILSGNPNLKRATIDNYDVRYEVYPSSSQMFSISGFKKEFVNPIELINRTGTSGAPELYYTNIKKVQNIGMEIEYRIKLDLFSRKFGDSLKKNTFLSNSTVYSNVSLINSTVFLDSIVGSGGNRPMQGQSPYIINAGYQFEHPTKDWSLAINYNVVGQRIFIVGNTQEPSVWENGRHVIDMQFAKRIKDKWEFKFNVKDLLAQKLLFFQDLNNDKKYTKGIDNRWQEISFGQTISLSASYKF